MNTCANIIKSKQYCISNNWIAQIHSSFFCQRLICSLVEHLLQHLISSVHQICLNMMNTSGTRNWDIKIKKKMEAWPFSAMKLHYSSIFCIHIFRKKGLDNSFSPVLSKKFPLLKSSCTPNSVHFKYHQQHKPTTSWHLDTIAFCFQDTAEEMWSSISLGPGRCWLPGQMLRVSGQSWMPSPSDRGNHPHAFFRTFTFQCVYDVQGFINKVQCQAKDPSCLGQMEVLPGNFIPTKDHRLWAPFPLDCSVALNSQTWPGSQWMEISIY